MAVNFDDLLPDDRTFIVRGQTFTWRDVRPEILSSFAEDTNGDSKKQPEDQWARQDKQILYFLVPEDHERWMKLRERTDDPVTLAQFNAILEHLVEKQTDRPTLTPSPSASGPGKSGRSSKAA